ncbi:MAG: SUMF1/EgtB/PvdO family nonheme iron enzyme, partial [Deltaproteobacteria bacterium]
LYNPSSKPTITSAITFKARAIKSGYTSSTVSSALYTVSFSAGDKATFTGSGVTFKMAYVPSGLTFKAGTGDATVTTVPNPYWIGETQVTYELWNTVKTWGTSHSYTFANAGFNGSTGEGSTQQPVVMITWRDAMVWTNALTEWYNAVNGTTYTCAYYTDAAYTTPIRASTGSMTITYTTNGSQDAPYVKADATGFRMAGSMEWELAARYKGADSSNGAYEWPVGSGKWWTPGSYASGATATFSDATATGLVAWYTTNSGDVTNDVKGKAANALGLYDMSGNVWQYNFDWSTVGSNRVIRGGSWYDTAVNMRVGYANVYAPYFTNFGTSLRVVKTY